VAKLRRFTCVETFCGAGGLGSGLKEAGFELLFAFDKDRMAVRTYRHNVSEDAEDWDINDISAFDILARTGVKKGELTLLSGGPPCQGFSRQKHKNGKPDKRNRLVVKYVRLVQGIEPMFFLVENVDMFTKKRGKKYLRLLEIGLSPRYDLVVREINCADYGVPQIRKRTIIVGVRKDLNIRYEFPTPTYSSDSWVTVGEALRGLPSPPKDGSEHPEYPNHCCPKMTKINIERISYVPQGSGRKCIPKRLRLPCHKKKTGWPDVYGRMSVDKPAPTITGGFDNFTRGRFAHPFENRPITYREAAILQTFSPEYRFFGTKADIRTQIGNAVPPLIGRILGESIIAAIKKEQATNEDVPTEDMGMLISHMKELA